MPIKNFYLLFVAVLLSPFLCAQAPSGYYNSASGKSSAELKTAMYQIIHTHTSISYGEIWDAYQKTDLRPDGKIWDIYTDIPNGTPTYSFSFGSNQCGTYSKEGDCYNREHSFPKSWFGGEVFPMYTDLFHIYPTDGYVNNMRSNYPYGEVGTASYSSSNGSKLGQNTTTGYTGTVFEPIDEYKGDLARSYFYMATCYEDKIADWASNADAAVLLAGNAYPAFKEWMINLLLKWSREDPVSQKEIDRNNAIYGIQGNRNPYIDNPSLAEYIWGNKQSSPFVLDEPAIAFASSDTIHFGKIAPETSSSQTYTLKVYNISDDISLAVSGTNASQFTLSVSNITNEEAVAGKEVTVTYSANAISKDSAMLTITAGSTSKILQLVGQGSNEFMALSATNISSNSFTANWTKSDNATSYILDVYKIKNTGFQSQVLFDYDFANGTTGVTTGGYTSTTDLSGAIRLASGSKSGFITTPPISTSRQTVFTLNAKQYSNDTNAPIYISVGNTNIDTVYTTNSFQDFSVEIPENSMNDSITLKALKGARVYISSITLETLGSATENMSIDGFPANVGNVLSYTISNLSADSTYYYTVKPVGGTDTESESIMVKTQSSTSAINQNTAGSPIVYSKTNGLYVDGISTRSKITVYDINGQKISETTSSKPVFISLLRRGVFVVSVDDGQLKKNFKTIL